ncbi:hypothetical protein PIB30_050818 [Stylosanthes scabra]|uniref:Uncharacterized protein n=1 Tax=Stylosanthes scabra TaxID=79078 RepID=A0ABU6UKK1_9FABA|nr:hypothetical protein [Stylosanthes scabra]
MMMFLFATQLHFLKAMEWVDRVKEARDSTEACITDEYHNTTEAGDEHKYACL